MSQPHKKRERKEIDIKTKIKLIERWRQGEQASEPALHNYVIFTAFNVNKDIILGFIM